MATITAGQAADWNNYHRTHLVTGARTAVMDVTDLLDAPWPQRWATTAGLLRAHLADAVAQGDRAGLIGRAWSLSKLTGNAGLQLDCGGRSLSDNPPRAHSGLTGCAWLSDEQKHPGSPYTPDMVAMVGGGATFREVADFAKSTNRSIRTSGSHLTPSVAGAIATGTHGSRLHYGAVQNQVLGLHIVTGPDSSAWIEPQSVPVLSDAAAAALDNHVTIIRDDAVFADALVHLGGMGAINGIALLTIANHGYAVKGQRTTVSPTLVDQLANGDFAGIAASLDVAGHPAFYEMSADHRAFAPGSTERSVFHTFYLTDEAPPTSTEKFHVPRASDWLLGLTEALSGSEPLWSGTPESDPPMSAADFYHQTSFGPFLARMAQSSTHSWDNIHGDSITGDNPGALYSSAIAVDRAQLPTILPLISTALASLLPAFLLTLRFVTRATGTLAYTHFDETAVIDIEGVTNRFFEDQGQPAPWPTDALVPAHMAVQMVRAALTDADIDYCMHWAKQGAEPGVHPAGVDEAALIERNFGPSRDSNSALSRWRRTRSHLLTPEMQRVFVNDALIAKGIVATPTASD